MEVISLIYLPNRRIPNGTYGGVRGRRLVTASYSIFKKIKEELKDDNKINNFEKLQES